MRMAKLGEVVLGAVPHDLHVEARDHDILLDELGGAPEDELGDRVDDRLEAADREPRGDPYRRLLPAPDVDDLLRAPLLELVEDGEPAIEREQDPRRIRYELKYCSIQESSSGVLGSR